MEEEAKTTIPKRRPRPAQKLYVPPAQRSAKKTPDKTTSTDSPEVTTPEMTTPEMITPDMTTAEMTTPEMMIPDMTIPVVKTPEQIKSQNLADAASNLLNNEKQPEEDPLVIMLQETKLEEDDKKSIDRDKEEMDRAIVNINRKTRPLIKHVNVGNSHVLHIDVKHLENPVRQEQVASWEDLFNEDDNITEVIEQEDPVDSSRIEEYSDDDEEDIYKRNSEPNDLDHVIELYDFPPSFKTPDVMQLFHEVNKKQSMYIKWCDETHALLVFTTPAQATWALKLKHDMIKTRSMNCASSIAQQVAQKTDLRPAMKRPQTNMQTARRLITSHLGTKSRISKEEQAREREELRKAKEMKKVQKQLEYDAWQGNPRPSTA